MGSGKRGRSTTDPVKWAHLKPIIRDAVIGPKAIMSQSELADKMGVSASAVNQWVNGEGNTPDPWNTLRALEIVRAPFEEVRKHFYALPPKQPDDGALANIARALMIDLDSLTQLGEGPAGWRPEFMQQREEIQRAAVAVMVLEGRTLNDVMSAADRAIDANPGCEGKDADFWVKKISGALQFVGKSESGYRISVQAVLDAGKR